MRADDGLFGFLFEAVSTVAANKCFHGKIAFIISLLTLNFYFGILRRKRQAGVQSANALRIEKERGRALRFLAVETPTQDSAREPKQPEGAAKQREA